MERETVILETDEARWNQLARERDYRCVLCWGSIALKDIKTYVEIGICARCDRHGFPGMISGHEEERSTDRQVSF
jgi:hypothetical protein